MQLTPSLPWEVAGRLVTAAGRKAETHTILRENVATLLTQFKPDFVESLQQLPQDKLMEGLNGSYANGPVHMALKLSRDIRQKPYDDESVLKRLNSLDQEFKEGVAAVLAGNPDYPCKFYVTGSLERGRFGAESDLDVACEASSAWIQAQPWNASQKDVSFIYLPRENPDLLKAFLPARQVTPEQVQQTDFLLSLYREGVERKGYKLEGGHLVPHSPTILREIEISHHPMWSATQMV